jgi:VIT1/CCC1 family predicted Fe2+/Mn2+ transporter
MATTDTPVRAAPNLEAFAHHWQDEADAAYLYRILSGAEADPHKKDLYMRLAEVEDRHVQVWENLMREHGRQPKKFSPTARTRLLARLGHIFGPGFLLPMLLREEGREVRGYLDMHRSTPKGMAGATESLTLAKESAEHAQTLNSIAGKTGEPWHRTESGGFLRNVVYGFNDGLTANFGLVAGVIGAGTLNVADQHHVIVAGVAGLIADALSMGSSGYLAAKSELEVYANEIAMERDEVALMPEIERDELAIIYETKGMSREAANVLATQVMADPQRMLDEQVQEELGISSNPVSPMREAWITGIATAIGAFIPVFPFLIMTGRTAIIVAFMIAMLSHWVVGAARSIFTGRSVFRSGLDMFVVGLGVAAVGYFVGEWIGRMM